MYLEKLYEIFPKGKENNDFSGLIWLVYDSARKNRLINALNREIRENKIKIKPPEITTYRNGFLCLACDILEGKIKREKLALFSDESLNFLNYEILSEYISENKNIFSKAGEYPQDIHKIKNFAKEFRKLSAFITEELKTKEFESIIEKYQEEPYKAFAYAWNSYKKKREEFEKNKGGFSFFSPSDAYRELSDSLKEDKTAVSAQEFNKNRIIIAEDSFAYGAVFKEILELLSKKDYKISTVKSSDFRKTDKGSFSAKGFVTVCDEAEFIADNIKNILSENKFFSEDIAVYCFSAQTLKALDPVFLRCGLTPFKKEKLGNSEFFKVFFSASKIYLDLPASLSDYEKVLFSKYCRYSLGKEVFFRNIEGKKERFCDFLEDAKNNFSEEIKFEDFLNQIPEDFWKKEEKEKINKFLELKKEKNKKFSDVLEKYMLLKENLRDNSVKYLYEISEGANKVLEYFKNSSKDDFSQSVSALLSSMSDLIYYGKKEKEVSIGFCEPSEHICSDASYVFLCGLDSSNDKKNLSPLPERLACDLKLKSDISYSRLKTYKIAEQAIKTAKESPGEKGFYCSATYGCKSLKGEYLGISDILIYLEKSGFLKEDIYSLSKFSDIASQKKKSFDESYSFYKKEAADKDKTDVFSESEIFNRFKKVPANFLLRLMENNGEIRISVDEAADFINCPRKFAFSVIEKKFEKKNKKSNFLKYVFTQAFKEEGFYDKNLEKIKESLLKIYKNKLKNEDSLNDYEKKETCFYLESYALKEAKRRDKEFKNVFSGEKIESEIGTIKSDSKEIKIILQGEIERLDSCEKEKIYVLYNHLFDRKEKISFGNSSSTAALFPQNYSCVKLGLIRFMAEKNKIVKDDYKWAMYNIYKNGDLLYASKYQTLKDNITDAFLLSYKIDLALKDFLDVFNNKGISFFYKNFFPKEEENRRIYNPNCSQCFFKEECGYVLLSEGLKDA